MDILVLIGTFAIVCLIAGFIIVLVLSYLGIRLGGTAGNPTVIA